MGATRTVQQAPGPNGEPRSVEMTNLEWALQFVKLKIQEMIFHGRKTDQCGVIVFGSEGTDNIVNDKHGGYEHVSEYIPICTPSARTLAKLDELEPSETAGDAIDALIVGIETQDDYLERKRTWTRKIVIVTDGASPLEIEDWEATVKRMSSLTVSLTVVGSYRSPIKRANESFYAQLVSALPENLGLMGTLEHALLSLSSPNIKETKSALMSNILRLGDVEARGEEALEMGVRVAKCTSLARASGWKRFFGTTVKGVDEEDERQVVFRELKKRTEYVIDRAQLESDGDGDNKSVTLADFDEDEEREGKDDRPIEKVEKEQLVRGYKYGSTYVPCPDGQFPKLETRQGIDMWLLHEEKRMFCAAHADHTFNRSYPLSEVFYVFATPTSAPDQIAFSSIVQAMYERGVLAIARMVRSDGTEPKMGVLSPIVWPKVDLLLWAQMPFADDIRHYTFPSLTTLTSRTGERITKHPYLPNEEQLEAMDRFIDDMDLSDAGEKDEKGDRQPWFDPRLSYNPAIHRTKQALFHAAVVPDLAAYPLPPPHPELTKYFEPPKRVLKRARQSFEACKEAFKVKEVPRKAPKARKDGHVRAADEDEDMILLDRKGPARKRPDAQISTPSLAGPSQVPKKRAASDSETETESEDERLPLPKAFSKAGPSLPTPTASPEPELDPQRAPGRIIGSTFPLKDFRVNLSRGDVVTKAVEDMGTVIREIVGRPFAGRRKDEMLECLRALRATCLKEDEIDAWNDILKGLKSDCSSETGNKAFWSEVKKLGRSISLISSSEAEEVGAISLVPDSVAEAVVSLRNYAVPGTK
ncbi:SPOC like C-terminal domain-containing protein [Pisolithus albus]|nr:SPOC like C-terminal domain-containing protein [Pisolithus albus]